MTNRSTASPAAASRPPRTTVAAFLTSSVAGVAHGSFSLYWAVGGSLLTDTVHAQLALLADRRWLLLTVAVIKTGFALLPLVLLARSYQRRQPIRVVCWFGAIVLLLWGGVNTVTGNLVLAGFIQPSDDYDGFAMAGNAWLWDPLFLLWGTALIIGLVCSPPRCSSSTRPVPSLSRSTMST